MSQQPQDQVREHSYDGIQEYDNQLPRWWVGTFVLTVIFGFIYWLVYHVYDLAPDQKAEYQQAMKAHATLYQSDSSEEITNEDLFALANNPESIEKAKSVYQTNCLACHGMNGEGTIGPNLTDQYWIHGGKPLDILNTLKKGVAAKGMPSWDGVLSPSQLKNLTAFILSLSGTNPINAKAPEGDLVE
jgi:cytochrome c oxidase cbb3-type subunit 3